MGTQKYRNSKRISNLFYYMIFFIAFCISNGNFAYTQTVKTVGGTGANYSTIKLAFDAINAGTVTGTIVLQITGNTTETASAVLNASGNGSASYSSVTIYPTSSGLTISGNFNLYLIDLNGADNVTIDGRVNATGTAKDLTIKNSNIGTSATTIRLYNSASSNIIKYCNIKGAVTSTSKGIIFFYTSSSGSGNDNNLIDNNNITGDAAGRPNNGLYSTGTSGRENSGNIISNNNIYDTWRTTASSYSIQLSSYSSDWTISGNSFYETTTLIPTGSYTYNPIKISNTSGNDFIITGNYIGGQSALCGGSSLTVNAANGNLFQGISLSVGTTTSSSVQGNTIKNFNYTSSSNSIWQGIYISDGSVNVGTTTGNTIGASSGTGSITVTGNAIATVVQGINFAGSGMVNIQNNIIGSITANNSNPAYASNIYAINRINTGTTVISNNLITNIIASSTSTDYDQSILGIRNTTGGNCTYDNNTISNLTNNTTRTTSGTLGIVSGILSNYGITTITNNTIYNLTNSNGNTASSSAASVTGIAVASTNALNTISGNTIYNLTNSYISFSGTVIGIYFGSTGMYTTNSHLVTNNFIHSLSVTGASASTASIYGIKINTGQTTYGNNIISLGGNTASTIYGIYEYGTSANNNSIYFNTIYISGSLGSGVTNKSYALFSNVTTNVRNFRNNIFVNARSTAGGSSLHYAAYFNYSVSTSLTLNYNNYYVTGIGGVLGYYNSSNKTSLPIITGKDTNSLNVDPGFTNAGGTSAEDYYSSATLPGATETIITTDFAGVTRGATPKIGAYESTIGYYTWQGNSSDDFGTASNWVGGVVPPNGVNIVFAPSPAHNCVLDQNRTIHNITNAQSSYKFYVNGRQLTVTGNFDLSNGATIDASTNSSVVVFAGTSAQIIPTGAFVNNTVDGLTINNSNGLTLNGNLTVTQTLTLTNGAFNLGANTLTLNGLISTTSGSLNAGSSTNLVIGGSSTSTTLPAITLNNLTLNRVNGIVLGGNVNIGGTFTLTSGTLTIGTNTLTFSGNTLTKTSGNIDASNSNATLSFTNSSIITLPENIFSGNINNLTINGTGGISVSNDIAVNGILNLQSANPTATKGSLDMGNYTLTMGSQATTIGIGDVTGIVKRTSFTPNVVYTFGNQYTTTMFPNTGTLPTEWYVKISIGTSPGWKTGAITRVYDIVRTGGSGSLPTVKLHYLDSELNGNEEIDLVFFGYIVSHSSVIEYGRANTNVSENWVSLTGSIEFAPTGFNQRVWTLSEKELPSFTWQGTVPGQETDWKANMNWVGGSVPTSTSDVIIPTGCSYYPTLPASTEIKSITIEAGAVVNGGTGTVLTINGSNGAWYNLGTLNPGTSKVIFNHGIPAEIVTVSGITNFYNIECAENTTMQPVAGCLLRIAGNGTAFPTSVVDFSNINNTVEYNGGDQTIVNPNGIGGNSGYYNLIFSGSGTKTMPTSSMNINGYLTISVTASATAASSLTIKGDLTVENGATFNTGAYDHSISGDIVNNSIITFNSSKTIIMNGTTSQSILGDSVTSFQNLTINNSNGVLLYTNININNTLTLTTGNLIVQTNNLGINGTINKISGHIEVNPLFSLSFGGTDAITLTSDLFTTLPSINNLTINRTNSITLGQDLTVNGILTLTNGLIILGDKNLILGSSATITGNQSSSSMIVATSTGELRKAISDERILPFSFAFPVGDNSETTEYSPITLNFTSGTFYNAYIGVTLGNTKYSNNSSTIDYLNRYWTVSQNGISNFSCDVTAQYLTADVVGSESNIWTGKYDGSSWTLLNQANAVNHTLTGTVTGFSTFTGGQQTSMPVELSAFNSSVNGRDVKLLWITASESNNAGFEIQKSVVGNKNSVWNKIGYIQGNGTKNTPTNYSFMDIKLSAGKFQYRLKQIDNNGNFAYHTLNNTVEIGIPTKFTLSQNYPNPFNPKTKIDFQIPNDTKVTMKVYDITGREIAVLINNELRKADFYTVDINGINFASGVYFCRIIADKYIDTKKMVLIK